MKNFLTLVKMNIKYTYFKFNFKTAKEKRKYIALIILLAVCFAAPIILITMSCREMVMIGIQNNMLHDILATLFFSSQIIVLIYGTISYINVVYFSKDNEFLLGLPVSQNAIFASKFIVVYLGELIFSAVFILPSTIITAVVCAEMGIAVSAGFYLMIIPAMLLIPLVPVFLISIISFPLSLLVAKLRRNPVVASILSILVFVGAYAAIYIPILKMSSSAGNIDFSAYLQTFTSISKYTVFAGLFAKAMLGIEFFKNMGLFLASIIAFTVIAIILSQFGYKKCISNLIEGNSSRRKSTHIDGDKKYIQRSPARSNLIREFKTTLRDPMMAFSSFMPCFLMPVLIFMITKFAFGMGNADVTAEDLAVMNITKYIMIAFMLIGVGASTNTVAMIAFSREGGTFSLLKTYPIKFSEIVKAKLLFSDIICFITILLSVLITAFLNIYNVIDIIGLFITSFLTSISISGFALFSDLKKPNLNWVSVKEITKNNMSSLKSLGISMAIAIVISAILGIFKGINLIKNEYLNSLVVWLICIAISVGVFFMLRHKKATNIDKKFEEIEC